MSDLLHVFALNEPVEVRHTSLTRQTGEAPVLPPLHEWIGVEGIDTDAIELFPVGDLAGLGLPSYLEQAYAVKPAELAEAAPRLSALDGSVLIVPEDALHGMPEPGPQARLVASLPMETPRHIARMEPAKVDSVAPAPGPATPPAPAPRGTAILVLVALVAAAALIWWLV